MFQDINKAISKWEDIFDIAVLTGSPNDSSKAYIESDKIQLAFMAKDPILGTSIKKYFRNDF
jgi:hypothetical protein